MKVYILENGYGPGDNTTVGVFRTLEGAVKRSQKDYPVLWPDLNPNRQFWTGGSNPDFHDWSISEEEVLD